MAIANKTAFKHKLGVQITPLAKAKLDIYGQLAHAKGGSEISGMGLVEQVDRETFLVQDLFMFDQECTSGDTDLDTSEVHDLYFELAKSASGDGRNINKLWWHFHPIGSWSGIDDGNIETLGKDSDSWLLSIFGNNANWQYTCRLDLFQPWRIIADELPMVLLYSGLVDYDALYAELRAEVELKLHKKTYAASAGGSAYRAGRGASCYKNGRWQRWDSARQDWVPEDEVKDDDFDFADEMRKRFSSPRYNEKSKETKVWDRVLRKEVLGVWDKSLLCWVGADWKKSSEPSEGDALAGMTIIGPDPEDVTGDDFTYGVIGDDWFVWDGKEWVSEDDFDYAGGYGAVEQLCLKPAESVLSDETTAIDPSLRDWEE